jgi:two-component system LytT family response regulator
MKTWRAMIVDDEAPARERLVRLLSRYPEISIVASAASVKDAAASFLQHQPNLVFLDIEMPGANGFELLPSLHPVPKIIFVTGHEGFAVKAFEVNAVDYLVKPVFQDRLDAALKRILPSNDPPPPDDAAAAPFSPEDLVFVRSEQSSTAIPVQKILYITASGNFSHVVSESANPTMVYRNLNQWQQRLPGNLFARIDRSLIINLSRVQKITTPDRNHAEVQFMGISEIVRIGRTALTRLRGCMHAC